MNDNQDLGPGLGIRICIHFPFLDPHSRGNFFKIKQKTCKDIGIIVLVILSKF